MHRVFSHVFVAGLLVTGASIAPANALVVQSTPPPIVPRVAPVRPRRSPDTGQPSQVQAVPMAKKIQTVQKAYYCDVESTEAIFNSAAKVKSIQFTLTPLADGTLVFGGKDAFYNTSQRFTLIDDGEWRTTSFAGWIEGKEPATSMFSGASGSLSSKWSIKPRIHKGTGEFSAKSYISIGGVTSTTVYAGTCTGGV